tara:strand:+ start:401 stop:571 length:171 start_codon:yes stop_codon:yes gene_type:complete
MAGIDQQTDRLTANCDGAPPLSVGGGGLNNKNRVPEMPDDQPSVSELSALINDFFD